MPKKEKIWPTHEDLLSYFMYEKYLSNLDTINSDWFKKVLEEFKNKKAVDLHKEYYNSIDSFKEKFSDPDDVLKVINKEIKKRTSVKKKQK